jgi:hypothetical protein
VTIGFLAGSLAAVLNEADVQWHWFIAAMAVGAVGLALVRLTEKRQSQSAQRVTFNMESVEASLDRIVNNITQLDAEKHTINAYDVRLRIDELFIDDLNAFVQARESIAHVHGLGAYAQVMSDFAAAERYLNRVWSASADGYVDEVNTYLTRSQNQFVEALEKVRRLKDRDSARTLT